MTHGRLRRGGTPQLRSIGAHPREVTTGDKSSTTSRGELAEPSCTPGQRKPFALLSASCDVDVYDGCDAWPGSSAHRVEFRRGSHGACPEFACSTRDQTCSRGREPVINSIAIYSLPRVLPFDSLEFLIARLLFFFNHRKSSAERCYRTIISIDCLHLCCLDIHICIRIHTQFVTTRDERAFSKNQRHARAFLARFVNVCFQKTQMQMLTIVSAYLSNMRFNIRFNMSFPLSMDGIYAT